jgi:hypothetical protein
MTNADDHRAFVARMALGPPPVSSWTQPRAVPLNNFRGRDCFATSAIRQERFKCKMVLLLFLTCSTRNQPQIGVLDSCNVGSAFCANIAKNCGCFAPLLLNAEAR